jgi:hypothetical protein
MTAVNGEATRPFRLRDNAADIDMRGRYYKHKENAHHAAMIFCDKWAPIGRSITVYNVETTRESGTYVRTVKGVKFV